MSEQLIKHISEQVEQQGYRVLSMEADPRIQEAEFEAVRSGISKTVVLTLSSASREAKLAIWTTDSVGCSLNVSSAFHDYQERIGYNNYRFLLFDQSYILLDRHEGWSDQQEISDFLASIVPS